MKKYLRLLVTFLGLSFALGVFPANADVTFNQLSHDVARSMDKQREFVSDLVKKTLPGKSLIQSASDFAIIQRIVNQKVLRSDQTWELQALGVCFGDALATQNPDLKWVLVTDEYGTDPTLRYKNTSLQINALTMISKRVERGEAVNIADMAERIKTLLAKEAKSLR